MILKLRRDVSANWAHTNPVLADGEPGYEKDTRKLKVGDGYTPWTMLPYLSEEAAQVILEPGDPVSLESHIQDESPHPIYDDGRAFALLYQNAKV